MLDQWINQWVGRDKSNILHEDHQLLCSFTHCHGPRYKYPTMNLCQKMVWYIEGRITAVFNRENVIHLLRMKFGQIWLQFIGLGRIYRYNLNISLLAFFKERYNSSDSNLLVVLDISIIFTSHAGWPRTVHGTVGQLDMANMSSEYVNRVFLETFLHPKSKTVFGFCIPTSRSCSSFFCAYNFFVLNLLFIISQFQAFRGKVNF